MTTPCTPTAPCPDCADANAREAKAHDTTCDHGHPCAMCVETAERGYEALAEAADDDYWAKEQAHTLAFVADGVVPDLVKPFIAPEPVKYSYAERALARDSRNQQDYDADLQQRRTANTEFDDDWLMAPPARKRDETDAFYWWWRGLQQGLALGVTQGNRDLQQMIEIAKERL